jgi:hypothetical protein
MEGSDNIFKLFILPGRIFHGRSMERSPVPRSESGFPDNAPGRQAAPVNVIDK